MENIGTTPVDKESAIWAADQHHVGDDILPGRYKITGTISANVTVRSSPNSRGIANIVTIQNFSGQYYVELIEGQYVEFSRSTMENAAD